MRRYSGGPVLCVSLTGYVISPVGGGLSREILSRERAVFLIKEPSRRHVVVAIASLFKW